jgi:uncharacterized protein with von Willebrand factor type A (vWA) domain
MVPHLIEFVHHLRVAGIPVSLVEAIDAANALSRIDLRRREHVKAAMAATLVKNGDHRPVFETHFDLYFSTIGELETTWSTQPGDGRPATGQVVRRSEFGRITEEDEFDFLEVLLEALLRADDAALRALAATAVQQFANVDTEKSASVKYYMHRLMKELDLGWLLQQGRHRIRSQANVDPFDSELDIKGLERRIAAFRDRMEREVMRRITRDRGVEPGGALSDVLEAVEGMEFLEASPEQLRRMRHAVRPLAKRLAAKLAQRRKRRNKGRLDIRRTVRRSLSTGGVPFDPAHRHRRESRPDLFLVADVSGSVAKFAEFTITFLNAMSEEFPKLRCFIFVDGTEEVTKHVKEGAGLTNVKHLIARSRDISRDGHSDHAKALDMFFRKYGTSLTGTSTVIFTGDGRNNYRVDDAGLPILKKIQEKSKQVFWLNPEPRSRWGVDDSLMPEYRSFCTGAFECRNLRQLQEFVLEIT